MSRRLSFHEITHLVLSRSAFPKRAEAEATLRADDRFAGLSPNCFVIEFDDGEEMILDIKAMPYASARELNPPPATPGELADLKHELKVHIQRNHAKILKREYGLRW